MNPIRFLSLTWNTCLQTLSFVSFYFDFKTSQFLLMSFALFFSDILHCVLVYINQQNTLNEQHHTQRLSSYVSIICNGFNSSWGIVATLGSFSESQAVNVFSMWECFHAFVHMYSILVTSINL